MITYSFACVVLNTGYEGEMKSYLSSVVLPPPIDTLEQFATVTSYKNIVFQSAAVEQLQAYYSLVPELAPIAHRIVPPPQSMTDFMYETLNGNAVAGSRAFFRIRIEQQLTNDFGITNVQIVPQMVITVPISFRIPHMNKFTKHIAMRTQQWLEAGLFDIQMKWEIERAEKIPLETGDDEYVEDKSSSWAPLPITMFRLLLVIYAVGMTFSVVAFLYEIRHLYKCKK